MATDLPCIITDLSDTFLPDTGSYPSVSYLSLMTATSVFVPYDNGYQCQRNHHHQEEHQILIGRTSIRLASCCGGYDIYSSCHFSTP